MEKSLVETLTLIRYSSYVTTNFKKHCTIKKTHKVAIFSQLTFSITGFTEKNSSSSAYIDLKRNPSDVLCILSKNMHVTYVRIRPTTPTVCKSINQIRPSVTDYMDIAHQIYKFNQSALSSVKYITDDMYGKLNNDIILLN